MENEDVLAYHVCLLGIEEGGGQFGYAMSVNLSAP